MNYLNKFKSCGQFLKKFSDSIHMYEYCSLETLLAGEILSAVNLQKILPVHPLCPMLGKGREKLSSSIENVSSNTSHYALEKKDFLKY